MLSRKEEIKIILVNLENQRQEALGKASGNHNGWGYSEELQKKYQLEAFEIGRMMKKYETELKSL